MKELEKGLVDWLLNRSTYITWPYFGFGNVMARCILDHSEYAYKPSWNYWGAELAPLDISGAAKTITCPAMFNGEYYTLAHFGMLLTLPDGWTNLREAVTQALRNVKDESTRRWLFHTVKRNSRIIIPVGAHIGANYVVQHTNQPIIALTWQNAEMIDTRCPHAWDTAKMSKAHYHHFVTPQSSVIKVPIETFIYGDANTWFPLFEQICAHAHIKTPHPERARAFCLYWRERVERFYALDKQTLDNNSDAVPWWHDL